MKPDLPLVASIGGALTSIAVFGATGRLDAKGAIMAMIGGFCAYIVLSQIYKRM